MNVAGVHEGQPPRERLAIWALKPDTLQNLAFNVVYALLPDAWGAVRFVLSGQKGLVSPRAALLVEEPDAVRFALPGARCVERFARATHARAGQPVHQRDAYSVLGARFPDAAGSTHANAAVGRTVSPEWTFSPNGCRTGDSSWFEYCSSGYWSRCYLTDDSRSEGGPMGCSGWANSPHDSQGSSLVTSSLLMRSEFHLDDSPLDFVTDDSPPGPRHALAAATSREHGKCHQQPGRKLRRVR